MSTNRIEINESDLIEMYIDQRNELAEQCAEQEEKLAYYKSLTNVLNEIIVDLSCQCELTKSELIELLGIYGIQCQ